MVSWGGSWVSGIGILRYSLPSAYNLFDRKERKKKERQEGVLTRFKRTRK